jgi:general secretion pathway protein L
VGEHARGRADPRQVLARLTELLPDTAYLTRFELRGDAVTAGGLAANAAAVLDMLGSQPDFQDLRAPGAIMRDAASGRETFLVEFRLAAGEGQ